jgi:predicted alpha/beta hydrolase family esterase
LVDSLENNVSVYEKQEIQIAHSLDLISVVKT